MAKEEFKRTNSVNPGDHIAVWTLWKRFDHGQRIFYKWRSPSGEMTDFYFDIKQGWNQTIVNLGNEKPAETGQWEVSLWDGDRKLTSTKFNVAAASP